MRMKLCKWFYDHGKYEIAYRISPSYTIKMLAEDVQNAMIEAINEARKRREKNNGQS